MKTGAFINLDCVYDTMVFIENNYDLELSIPDLESVAHYSYRNIQRIFKYSCGETIGAYQKRLRLENAYKMILYTQERLAGIGLKAGFANQASFSKSFKQQFGITPKAARSQKVPLLARAGILPVTAELLLKPDLIYIAPVRLYYKSVFINYLHEEIESVWTDFMQHDFRHPATIFMALLPMSL